MFLVLRSPFEDAADASLVLFGLNLVWLPVSIILVVLEAWPKKQIGKRPANAGTAASGIVPPAP